jgi:hypothetical protein
MRDYWQKQELDKPLFPDMQWSKPENKSAAGKLLIIGGHAQGLAAPAQAYQESLKAGIGTAKVLLPDSLHKIVGNHLETAEFAPSTPAGSFSRKALSELLDHASWADATLVAGELGRNSETAILLESFATKHKGPLALTRDSVDYFHNLGDALLDRPGTLLVISMSQLQKLCTNSKFLTPIRFSMDLLHLIDALHVLTQERPVHIMVKHLDTILVASGGQVSTTRFIEEIPIWRVRFASHAATWWLQHQHKPFEALTTSVIVH